MSNMTLFCLNKSSTISLFIEFRIEIPREIDYKDYFPIKYTKIHKIRKLQKSRHKQVVRGFSQNTSTNM